MQKNNNENIIKAYKKLKQFNDLVKKEEITNLNEIENKHFKNQVKTPRQKVVREFDLVRSMLRHGTIDYLDILYQDREVGKLYYKVYEYVYKYYDTIKDKDKDVDFRLNMAKLSLLLGFDSNLVTQFEELEGIFEEKVKEIVADEDINLKNNSQNHKVLKLHKK